MIQFISVLLFLSAELPLISGDCPLHDNTIIGIQILNFTNAGGKLANGRCCDDPSTTVCPIDLCDTVFQICGTRARDRSCDVFPSDILLSAVMFNNNSFQLGSKIGNRNSTSSFVVYKIPFSDDAINFTADVYDDNTGPPDLIASWTFQVNWTDLVFSSTSTARYRHFLFHTPTAQLGLQVVSQCEKYYFGPSCSECCTSTSRYSCAPNGTKNCLTGWEGKECDVEIDHCPGHACINGATCTNNLNNYTCLCPADFTGVFCELSLRSTTTTARSTSISTSETTTARSTSISTSLTSTTKSTATSTLRPTSSSTHLSKSTLSSAITTLSTAFNIPSSTTAQIHPANTELSNLPTHPRPLTTQPTGLQKSDSEKKDLIWTIVGCAMGVLLILGISVCVWYFKSRYKNIRVTPSEADLIPDETSTQCVTSSQVMPHQTRVKIAPKQLTCPTIPVSPYAVSSHTTGQFVPYLKYTDGVAGNCIKTLIPAVMHGVGKSPYASQSGIPRIYAKQMHDVFPISKL